MKDISITCSNWFQLIFIAYLYNECERRRCSEQVFYFASPAMMMSFGEWNWIVVSYGSGQSVRQRIEFDVSLWSVFLPAKVEPLRNLSKIQLNGKFSPEEWLHSANAMREQNKQITKLLVFNSAEASEWLHFLYVSWCCMWHWHRFFCKRHNNSWYVKTYFKYILIYLTISFVCYSSSKTFRNGLLLLLRWI